MGFLKSTNISPCVLEQKDIASYIPYGLKVQDRDLDIWLLSQLGNVDPCMDGDVGLCCDGGDCQQYDYLSDIKPILRPMSDLVKEITHRGQTFVPMVEIAKLLGYSGLVRCKNGGHVATSCSLKRSLCFAESASPESSASGCRIFRTRIASRRALSGIIKPVCFM